MTPKTMEKALSVALKLAAVPGLVACSGTQEAPSSPPVKNETEASKTSTQTAPPDDATTVAATEPAKDCKKIVGDAVAKKLGTPPQGAWFNPEFRRKVDDPEAIACCEGLTDDKTDKTQEYRDMQCCLVNVDDRHFCTPWGPPMPPSMVE